MVTAKSRPARAYPLRTPRVVSTRAGSGSRGTGGGRGIAPATAILAALVAGGSLLAFRWQLPAGNVSIGRVAILAGLGFLFLSTARIMPAEWLPPMVAALALLGICSLGLLYTPAFTGGVIQVQNMAESLVVFFLSALLVVNVVQTADAGSLRRLSAAPLWGFLPTGFLGLYQAYQLAQGQAPTIPLLQLTRLSEGSANAARTAFGGGLNDYGLDRIAGATGDPPTYGVLCALILCYTAWGLKNEYLLRSRLTVVVVLCALCGIVLSASGAALIVLGTGILFYVPKSAQGWITTAVRAAMCLLAFSALFLSLELVRNFVLSAEDRVTAVATGKGSSPDHLKLMGFGWSLFLDHAGLGVGTGGLTYHQYGYELDFSSVHNTLLLRLAENGIVGGLLLLAFWLLLRSMKAPWAILAPAIVALLVYLDFNRLPALWAIVGVAAGITWRATGSRPGSNTSIAPPRLATTSTRGSR